MSNIQPFSFRGITAQAHVVRIIDGDTLVVAMDICNNTPMLFNIRLSGINTPELRSKDKAVSIAAKAARDYLGQIAPIGSTLTLELGDFDNFGRILADGCVSNESNNNHITLSQQLLQAGHAMVYAKHSHI
jgi:endonuclease YncB( thermonuclease family)